MPKKRIWNKSTGRQYEKEAAYDASPARKSDRAARNRARYKMMKKGLVRVGDGKDIDHKNFNQKDNRASNLRVLPASKNRSYPRTKTGKPKLARKKK